MAVILRYFTEFGKPAFQHITAYARKKNFTCAISSDDELLICFLRHAPMAHSCAHGAFLDEPIYTLKRVFPAKNVPLESR